MNYMEDLLRKQRELLGQGEEIQIPESPTEQVEDIQEAESKASIAQSNEEMKSPNQKTKPEIVQDEIKQEASRTPAGQLSKIEQSKQQPTSTESLLNKINAIKQQQADALQQARETDRRNSLIDVAGKFLNTAAQSEIQRGAGQVIKTRDIDVEKSPSEEGKLLSQNREQLKQLMDQYKMMQSMKDGKSGSQYFNTQDGIVKVDKDTGKTELVRENVLGKDRESRLGRVTEKNLEKADRLSDKQTESIETLDFATKLAKKIQGQFEDKSTGIQDIIGPYGPSIESGKDYVPFLDGMSPEFSKFKSNLTETLATYIKDKSGAQVSDKERKFLEGALPSINDKPQKFRANMEEFLERLKMVKEGRFDSIEKQGKNIDKFKEDDVVKEQSKKDPKIEQYAEQYGLDYNKAKNILIQRGYKGK